MPQISFIGPLDQPLGNRRLLTELRAHLVSGDFTSFRFVVAYAKSGPLLRLKSDLEAFKAAGGKLRAIVGIDQQGTSREAVQLLLDLMDSTYITSEPGITFHPKLYIFHGPNRAICFVGSNNLTVGGTEANFESATCLDLSLPADIGIFASVKELWTQLLPASCPATQKVDDAAVAALISSGALPNEMAMARGAGGGGAAGIAPRQKSGLAVKPPSALPKAVLAKPQQQVQAPALQPPQPNAAAVDSPAPVQRFAIQIRPHDNGEIFLSVTAALQNPNFFDWPFNGATTPKKAGNPSYPQLEPDPIVDIDVYGVGATPILTMRDYALNTVYYATNSEIRITASPLVGVVPEYSVMVMEKNPRPGVSYYISIYTPSSPEYAAWDSACNQQMPGGGKKPRKFGWF